MCQEQALQACENTTYRPFLPSGKGKLWSCCGKAFWKSNTSYDIKASVPFQAQNEMEPTLKMGFSTKGPCAVPVFRVSSPGYASGADGGFRVQNAKQSINIKIPMVNAVRAVVGHRRDLTAPNSRTNEPRICRLGRVWDHRGGFPFVNCAQSFACRLCRCKDRGVINGEYGYSSTSLSSGPSSR
jgi:hypothetical protein